VKLYDYQQAAAELNVSVSFLKKRVREGTVPFRRLGDLVRFSQSDLEAIANQAAFTPSRRTKARGRR
jgi:excisionase family DNA binding protein